MAPRLVRATWPLRDFDEATVARVALELARALAKHRSCRHSGVIPTSTKRPLARLHLLIADRHSSRSSDGSEIRRPQVDNPTGSSPALGPGGATGGSGTWRCEPGDRASAVATSAILLTLLPIARHGRLAMLLAANSRPWLCCGCSLRLNWASATHKLDGRRLRD